MSPSLQQPENSDRPPGVFRSGLALQPHPGGAHGAVSGMQDLVVLSHLRWDLVFQRPQHLLSRFAAAHRVFYVEEPIFGAGEPHLEIKSRENGVQVVVPHLRGGISEEDDHRVQRELLDRLFTEQAITDYSLWLYTPMALPFCRHLFTSAHPPRAVAYDCMDELSLFKGAHPRLLDYEKELFDRADIVFTGGQGLYEHKRDQHANIHAFPSSIDRAHFGRARADRTDDPSVESVLEPVDQKAIPGPKIGFFGVIDERLDRDLLDAVAAARPDWHFVMLGPVVKITHEMLPQRANIHYLGGKHYRELPAYLAGWDVAILPFARNESTRFISPTKTPEYLAAGRPVVSTSIRDVIRPYQQLGLVQIADEPAAFVEAISAAMAQGKDPAWLRQVDQFLMKNSWDETWAKMADLLRQSVMRNSGAENTRSSPADVQA